MNKYSDKGITAIVTNDKLKIEISIKNLVNAFNLAPDNFDESKVKRGKRIEFANYVAEMLIDTEDPDTGDTPVTDMLDRIFNDILDNGDDGQDIIDFKDDED